MQEQKSPGSHSSSLSSSSSSLTRSDVPVGPSLEPGTLEDKGQTKIDKEVAQLLQHVADAEYEAVETLLAKKPELLLYKSNVTDLSKRTFTNITAFQYALWALDWNMWTIFLRYLTPVEAVQQWRELETIGTTHGKEVSWHGLIEAYALYHAHRNDQAWYNVGIAQLLLPTHVANEYFNLARLFYPAPNFTVAVHSKGGRALYDPKCGVTDTWARCNGSAPALVSSYINQRWYGLEKGSDVEVFSSLLTTRRQQKEELTTGRVEEPPKVLNLSYDDFFRLSVPEALSMPLLFIL